MHKRNYFSLLSLIFIFPSLFLCAKPLDLEVNAKAAILINADNGKVLFEKNADVASFPASTTKIATLMYIVDKKEKDLNRWFKASQEAIRPISPAEKHANYYKYPPYWLETDGTHYDIMPGESLPLISLLYGLMHRSGNDAANVAAEAVCGTINNFMNDLNQYLNEIGCKSTHFCNPHGLHYPEHVTTARDLAIMAKKGIKIPIFKKIFFSRSHIRPKTNKQQRKECVTYNQLVKPGKDYYQFALGGKTGYHAKAGFNLVSVAQKDDRCLISVVLGNKTNQERYKDAIKLFDAAFNEKKVSKILVNKSKMFLAKLNGASSKLKAFLVADLVVEYYASEEEPLKVFIEWQDIKLPIKKGDSVGIIKVMEKDKVVKSESLVAKDNVNRTMLFAIKEFFKNL